MSPEKIKLRLKPEESRIKKLVEMVDSPVQVSMVPSRLLNKQIGDEVIFDENIEAHQTHLWTDKDSDRPLVQVNLSRIKEIKSSKNPYTVIHLGNVDSVIYKEPGRRDTVITEMTGDLKFVIISRKAARGTSNWAFLVA